MVPDGAGGSSHGARTPPTRAASGPSQRSHASKNPPGAVSNPPPRLDAMNRRRPHLALPLAALLFGGTAAAQPAPSPAGPAAGPSMEAMIASLDANPDELHNDYTP